MARDSAGPICYHVLNRGTPFGSSRWATRRARRLGLESTLRPRGRPKKSTKKGNAPFLFYPFLFYRQVKIAAVVEGKSVKQLPLDLAEAPVTELEKKRLLPKGKG